MTNTPNEEPIKAKEYFAIMRLLQTLENKGYIPGEDEHVWQSIYDKLNHQCYAASKKEREAKL